MIRVNQTEMKHVKKLPQEVCSLMRSAVIIPTPSQAVVELVFNSIDANASCIAVRVDLRLFKIQVIDNGHGISLSDLEFIGNRSITSKCYSLDEFYNNLKYHGYRGEALASLREMCGLLEVVSFPLEGNNTYKKLFVHGKEEKIKECQVKRPSHGTTVTITDFMFNMPVRRQKMKAAIELEAIRSSIEYIALAHPEISISIRDDTKEKLILEKHRSSSLLSAFEHLFGSKIASTLAPVNFSSEKFKISGYISKEAHRHNDLQFIYVNRQPIMKTKLHKLVTSLLCMSAIIRTNGPWKNRPIRNDIPTERWLSFPFLGKQNKFSVFVINVECARKEYEICWSSKKPLIYFNDWEDVLECISNAIKGFLKQENLVMEVEGEQELNEKEIDEEIKVNTSPNKSKFSSGYDASKDRLQINEIITQSFETNTDPVVVSVEGRNESLKTFCEVETTAPTNEKNDKMDYCCVEEKYVPHSLQVKCVEKDETCVGKSSGVVDVSKSEEVKKSFKNSYKFSNFKCPIKSKLISVKRNQNCETNKTAGYRSAVSRKIKGLLCSKQNIEKEKKIFFMNNSGCINKNSRSSQNIELPVFTHNSSEFRADASNSQSKNDADMSILSLSENAELSESCSSNYVSNQRINEILIFDDSKVAKAEVSSTKNCEISQKNIMIRSRGPLGEDFHESVDSMTNIPKLLCSEYVSKKLRINNVNDNQLYALSSEFRKQSNEEGLSSSSELTIRFPNKSKNVESSVDMLSDGECKPLRYNSVLRNTLNSPNCISTYERYSKEENITDKLNFFPPGESTEQSKELVMECSSESDSFSSDDRIVYFRNVFKCFVESQSSEKVSELKSPYFTTPSSVQACTGDKKLHNHKKERKVDFSLHGRIFQEEYSLLSTPTVNEDELEFPKRRKISERERECVNKDETSQKSEQSQKILFPDKVVDSNELMVCDLVSKQFPYNLEMPPNPSEVLNSFMNSDSENSRSSKWRKKDNISSEEKLNISDVLRPIQALPDFSLISAKMCGLLFQQKFDKRIFQNLQLLKPETHVIACYAATSVRESFYEMCGLLFQQKFDKRIFQNLQIVNQLDNKFIVTLCSLENMKPHILAVFDQHAVHERIRLEALMKEYTLCPEDYTFKSTVLCEPLVLTVTSKQMHVLSSFQYKFEKLGLYFTLEEKSEISVFRVPTCMYTRFLRERSRQWLEESLHILIQDVVLFLINTGGQDSLVPEIFKSVINSEACKGAIKFGDTLTIEQCKELLFKLSECDLPFFCAHGRPSFMPLFDLNQFEEERKKSR